MKRGALILVGLSAGVLLFGSGGDPGPSFQPGYSPEDETQFEAGKLGLITSDLGKTYELLAFRSLSGLTIDPTKMNVAGPRIAVLDDGSYNTPNETWLKARSTVLPAMPANTYLNPFKPTPSTANVDYKNCLDDAFLSAARTLADRRVRYQNESELRSWVEAQNQVFANCSEKTPAYPSEPEARLSALARADRRYQIAAAHFYAEDFDTAEELFRVIAADQSSPWQKTGEYMVGRTLLREVSLQNNLAAANAAREQFRKVAADPAAGRLRDSARGLIELLDGIEHPDQTLKSLAKQLMAPRPDATFKATLDDSYHVMLVDSFRYALSEPSVPEPFEWVRTLESADEVHAVERWRAQNSLPWLTLALIHASGKDATTAELIEKAKSVAANSPAFVTVSYNAIRLRMERGEKDEPRRQLDRLLGSKESQPASVLNAWRAERMRLATSFDDFLRWAPRTPIDGDDWPLLDEDSIRVLNYATPLPMLVKAAHSSRLPPWSAADVALAAWTRAFILEDAAVMSDSAEIVGKAHPNWAAQLKPQPGDEWRFRTAVLIGRNAEFDPVLLVDYRKHLVAHRWWCAVSPPKNTDQYAADAAWRLPVGIEPGNAGISAADATEAAKEIDQLNRPVPSVVGPIILAWAKSHPNDPLVPEALHRVVSVVRYGCQGSPDSGTISRAAFDLLHKKYPKSDWTAKTPYWFK